MIAKRGSLRALAVAALAVALGGAARADVGAKATPAADPGAAPDAGASAPPDAAPPPGGAGAPGAPGEPLPPLPPAWQKHNAGASAPVRPAEVPGARDDTIYDERGRPVATRRAEPAPRRPDDDRSRRGDDEVDGDDDGLTRLPPFGIEGSGWLTRLSGKFEHDEHGVGESRHLQADDFGLGRYAPALDVRASWRFVPHWTLEVEYMVARYSGLGTLGRDFDYDGLHLAAGTPVKLVSQEEMGTFELRWEGVSREHFRLSVPLGLGWFSQLNRLEDRATGERTRDRIDLVTPFIGLAFDAPIAHGFGIESKARIFGFGWGEPHDDFQFGIFDFDARAYFTVAERARLFVGYRFVGVDDDRTHHYRNTIEGDWDVSAFEMGLGLYF
jgi:hypothetical protein